MRRRRALIWGLGRLGGGREAASWLLRRGWQLRIADRAPAATLQASVRALAEADPTIDWRLGEESPRMLEGVDLVVVNPAVPAEHPLLRQAQSSGLPVTQEVNLFLEAFPGRVVLVSGTNGKSTTASLLAAALRRSGLDCLLGGNLGHSLLAESPAWRAGQIAVCEISSFQLERIQPERHRVAGSVLTRVTHDHLDRHGSLAAYHRAKARAAAAARGFLVHAASDQVAAQFSTPAARRVRFTDRPPGPGQVGLADDWLVSALTDPGPLLHAGALRLLGKFQVEHVLAAFAAAHLLGADRHAAGLALALAPTLPHRLQALAPLRGIRLYDNGVSTELQSTLAAALALQGPIHWVGGGKSKDSDFDAIATSLFPRLASVHLFGASAAPLAARCAGRMEMTRHRTLRQALDAAWHASSKGEAILFSPAFTSFDQYANFRERAEDFLAWVETLRQELSYP